MFEACLYCSMQIAKHTPEELAAHNLRLAELLEPLRAGVEVLAMDTPTDDKSMSWGVFAFLQKALNMGMLTRAQIEELAGAVAEEYCEGSAQDLAHPARASEIWCAAFNLLSNVSQSNESQIKWLTTPRAGS